jgi:hypothetical protein
VIAAVVEDHFGAHAGDFLALGQRVEDEVLQRAFLASGVAAGAPESIGENYVDADGTKYQPMFGQPVLVLQADAEQLGVTLERALGRNLVPALFTTELFGTGHDAANRAAVASKPRTALDLAGLALRGPRRDVDKITKGLRLYA